MIFLLLFKTIAKTIVLMVLKDKVGMNLCTHFVTMKINRIQLSSNLLKAEIQK